MLHLLTRLVVECSLLLSAIVSHRHLASTIPAGMSSSPAARSSVFEDQDETVNLSSHPRIAGQLLGKGDGLVWCAVDLLSAV